MEWLAMALSVRTERCFNHLSSNCVLKRLLRVNAICLSMEMLSCLEGQVLSQMALCLSSCPENEHQGGKEILSGYMPKARACLKLQFLKSSLFICPFAGIRQLLYKMQILPV